MLKVTSLTVEIIVIVCVYCYLWFSEFAWNHEHLWFRISTRPTIGLRLSTNLCSYMLQKFTSCWLFDINTDWHIGISMTISLIQSDNKHMYLLYIIAKTYLEQHFYEFYFYNDIIIWYTIYNLIFRCVTGLFYRSIGWYCDWHWISYFKRRLQNEEKRITGGGPTLCFFHLLHQLVLVPILVKPTNSGPHSYQTK